MDATWGNGNAFLVAGYFAVGFVAARFLFDRYVFRIIAVWLLSCGARPLTFNETTQAKILKCTESMWKLAYYASVEIWVLSIVSNEPWFWDTKEYFRGWPNQELKLPLKLFYMCQCGFYIYSIAALLTWETRRKDFSVMMSHHAVTVILISYSYYLGIGSIVLAVHDASDVILETAKLFKNAENELGASVFFGMFAISWLILRLIFFPFWLIKSTSVDLIEYLKTYAA
uniref:TLC domain-containing protein n=1 Tax=Kalanchoe fedtschenkoi TaxID=63787 RepID=A0A7N0T466_KALFE